MENGKQYLIIIKQKNKCYSIKLAYWFEERVIRHYTYKTGFYHSSSFYNPYKNVVDYIDMDSIPEFYLWEIKHPIEGERYLVYRVGTSWDVKTPHYTIRKYHNSSFGSGDVKYWIKLSEVIKHEF